MTHAFRHPDDRLSAFLDDELDDREALAVTHHVVACDRCRDELEELRGTRAAVRGLPPVEAPLAFMVESVLLGPAGADDRGPSLLALGGVVAVSVLLVTAFVLGGDGGEVAPDLDVLVGDHVESVGGGPVVVPVTLESTDR